MLISLWNGCLRVICVDRYDYLFSRGTFDSHVEFWFTFQPFVVNYIIDFNNLIKGQFEKSVLDFNDFFNVTFRGLCI